jgi:hypothetical protein
MILPVTEVFLQRAFNRTLANCRFPEGMTERKQGNSNGRSRFPRGMTERKARTFGRAGLDLLQQFYLGNH